MLKRQVIKVNEKYTIEELLDKIAELELENEELRDKLAWEIQDKEDNYKPLTPDELIDWSERW